MLPNGLSADVELHAIGLGIGALIGALGKPVALEPENAEAVFGLKKMQKPSPILIPTPKVIA